MDSQFLMSNMKVDHQRLSLEISLASLHILNYCCEILPTVMKGTVLAHSVRILEFDPLLHLLTTDDSIEGSCLKITEISTPGTYKTWALTSYDQNEVTLITFDKYEWNLQTIFQSDDGYVLAAFSRNEALFVVANISNPNSICRFSNLNSSVWEWDVFDGCWRSAADIFVPIYFLTNQTLCGPDLFQSGSEVFFNLFDEWLGLEVIYSWNLKTGSQIEIYAGSSTPVYFIKWINTLAIFFDNATVSFYTENYVLIDSQQLGSMTQGIYSFNSSTNILTAFGNSENISYILQFYSYENRTFTLIDQSPPVDLFSSPFVTRICSSEYQTLVLGSFYQEYDNTALWDGEKWTFREIDSVMYCHSDGDSIVVIAVDTNPSIYTAEGSLIFTFPLNCSLVLTTMHNGSIYIICDNTVYRYLTETEDYVELATFSPSVIQLSFWIEPLFAISPDGNSLFLFGSFNFVTENFNYSGIAKYSLKNQDWEYFDPISGPVFTVAMDSKDNIYVGGIFGTPLHNQQISNLVGCQISTGICSNSMNGGVPYGVYTLLLLNETTLYMTTNPPITHSFHGWVYNITGNSPAVQWSDSLLGISINYASIAPPLLPFYQNPFFIASVSLAVVIVLLFVVFLLVKFRRRGRKDYIFLPDIAEPLFITFPKMKNVLEGDTEIVKIEEKDIKFIESIGEGGQGKIFKALYNHKLVAAKSVSILDPLSLTDFRKEIKILRYQKIRENISLFFCSSLHHENIVQFYGICMTVDCVYMITELMEGSIDKILSFLNPDQKLKVVISIADAMYF